MSGIFLQEMNKTRYESRIRENKLTSLTVLGRMSVTFLILLSMIRIKKCLDLLPVLSLEIVKGILGSRGMPKNKPTWDWPTQDKSDCF